MITVTVSSTMFSSSSCEEAVRSFRCLPKIRGSDVNGRPRTPRSLGPSASRNLGKRKIPITLTPTPTSATAQRPIQAAL